MAKDLCLMSKEREGSQGSFVGKVDLRNLYANNKQLLRHQWCFRFVKMVIKINEVSS
jgi:hypothetical protein